MNEPLLSETGPKPETSRVFRVLAIAYLALPTILFLVTWLKPWIGIPCGLIVAGCCINLFRTPGASPTPKLGRGTAIFVCVLALYWTIISGTGGYLSSNQGQDYIKQNLLFNDLVHKDWPVVYDVSGGGKDFLCYSLGYYLVPAMIARCLGEGWISAAAFLWTFLGIWLFFWWVAHFNRKAPARTLLFFLFFGGVEILWYVMKTKYPDWSSQLRPLGVEFDYPDWWTKMSFAPQHALAAWLGAALFYDMLWLERSPRGIVLVWAMIVFWSPLTPLGLLLVPLLALPRLKIKDAFEVSNILGGGVLLAILAVYFQAHMPITDKGWIWSLADNWKWVLDYLLFIIVHVLLPVVCIFLIDRKYHVLRDLKPLFLGAVLALILLPIYKMGYFNDLSLQVSAPLLVFLSLGAAACFTCEQFSLRKPLFLVFALIFLACASYELVRPWECIAKVKRQFDVQHTQQVLGIMDISQLREGTKDLSSQYMGRPGSMADQYLLKK